MPELAGRDVWVVEVRRRIQMTSIASHHWMIVAGRDQVFMSRWSIV